MASETFVLRESPMKTAEDADAIMEKMAEAQKILATWSQEQIDKLFKRIAMLCTNQRLSFAKIAVEETKLGQLEDKVVKNHFASEYVFHRYKDLKTCGIIEESIPDGITTIAEPVGPILGITPVTNPTSTVIFKSLIALKTRNTIVFLPHPRSQKSSFAVADYIRRCCVEAGAPDNLVHCAAPSKEMIAHLMHHKHVHLIIATGGPAMVLSAYSCGKPAIGVGAGNAPIIIDESANLLEAISAVVQGKSFDNATVCASEQVIIMPETIYDQGKMLLRERGVYILNPQEKEKVGHVVIVDDHINADSVGQSAKEIAKRAGITVPDNTVILAGEATKIGPEEPFSFEKLCPVIGLYKAKNFDDCVDHAVRLASFGGVGHTSGLHSKNEENIKKWQAVVPTFHNLINMPTSLGAIGSGYNFNLEPSLTLGCGTSAGSSTSVNLGPMQLVNLKKVVYRRDHIEWFKVPKAIYFNKYCTKDALLDIERFPMAEERRVFIVTDKIMVELGMCDQVIAFVKKANMKYYLWSEVQPDPNLATVREGIKAMQSFKPNVMVALGGGSPLDCSKMMRLMYEHPEFSINELVTRFIEIRHRNVDFPNLGSKVKFFVTIPTTSGTGSEMTPFAVITGDDHIKYPICSYRLTPDVAIIDSAYAESMPFSLAAMTSLDALTHAVESHVSVFSSDYTRPYSKKAFVDTYHYLPKWKESAEAKEKVHNAASIAGMAFANAFLGICHSIAHQLGAEFHIPHGLCNALLLTYVIRFNATMSPTRQGYFPQHTTQLKTMEGYGELAESIRPDCAALGADAKIDVLIEEIEKLKKTMGIKVGIKEYGVAEDKFMAVVDTLAERAFDDQCTGTNPVYPMIPELKEILIRAFKGVKA